MESQPPSSSELERYRKLLQPEPNTATKGGVHRIDITEELKTVPLVWWDVKERFPTEFSQYAVLGHEPASVDSSEPRRPKSPSSDEDIYAELLDSSDHGEGPEPVLLNTNSPWSAFLCGSQGSGKSHTLSCMLENCLISKPEIGKNPNPLAGLVFCYDSSQGSGVCEAAYLSSEVSTTVLVSPSNFKKMKLLYSKLKNVKVEQLYLLPKHLTTERVKTLMAVGKDGEMPLYMQTAMKILREMAMKSQGAGSFNYNAFKSTLEKDACLDKQSGPLKMRLNIMESFMKTGGGSTSNPETDFLQGEPGQLTIIDLTDPMVDADSACTLFNICLEVFISQTECGKVVSLDEAHNYMTEDSTATKTFTAKLLKTIREQRHVATRVIIATQEPGINTSLLDLCNITMVHRCTSPSWFAVLKKHIGGIYLATVTGKMGSEDGESEEGPGMDDKRLFKEIVNLHLGESLLFCTTAAVDVDGKGKAKRMSHGFVKFKTRERVTADGGRSRLAQGG